MTIVKNADKAYGYNYTSLASLAAAGVDIPKMRTATFDGKEYVEYLDEAGEWQRGAAVIVPDMKGMNAAQAYGSALTYARRYTVMMAKSVACTDDQLLETQEPKAARKDAIETPERHAPRRETRKTPEPIKDTTPEEKPAEAATETNVLICEDCGQPIKPYGRFDIMTIAARSYATYGKNLCWDCAGKAKVKKEELKNA